jgi:hypothetical protein
MTVGIDKNGTDLDSIFALWHAGWPQAPATTIEALGANLNARYAPLSTGTAAAATGIYSASADLNTIFAGAGTTGVTVGTQPSNVSGTAAAGYPNGTITSNSASCAGAKGGGTYTYTWHTTGCTATSPSSASSTFYATVNAGSTDNASAYCTISDGVTSVNTGTISVTLINTTPNEWVFSIVAGQIDTLVGYYSGQFGTITGATLPTGQTIYAVWQDTIIPGGTINSGVIISGFSSDPGSAFFESLEINGLTFNSSTATYTYGVAGAGWAEWIWDNDPYSFVNGTTYPGAFIP